MTFLDNSRNADSQFQTDALSAACTKISSSF